MRDIGATWNLRLGQAVRAVPGLLASEGLSWLAVQEVGGPAKVEQLRDLVRPLGYRVYAATNGDSAVIARKSLSPAWPARHRLGGVEWERKPGRPGLHPSRHAVSVRVGGRPGYRVASVHIPPGPHDGPVYPLRRKAALAAFARVRSILRRWNRRDRAWVAAGDWNTKAANPAMWMLAAGTGGRVHAAKHPGIDYFLVSPRVVVESVRRVASDAGDHDPVLIVLTLKEKP